MRGPAITPLLTLLTLTALSGCMPQPGPSDTARNAGAAVSRWSIVRDGSVAWLVKPDGERFFSLGINGVNGGGRHHRPAFHWPNYYPDYLSFVRDTRGRLRAWGFNTLGAWSLPSDALALPTTPSLELGFVEGFYWGDPFHPNMAQRMRRRAEELCTPYRGRPHRIGYFSDNERGWWNGPLYTVFIRRGPGNYTKQRLVAFLRSWYADNWRAFAADFHVGALRSFDDLLRSEGFVPRLRAGRRGIVVIRAWTGVVSRHYYRLAHDAIRATDPDALILGDRLPIFYDPVAVAAMAPWVDVISVNYNPDSPDGWVAPFFLRGLRELTDKPVLISEWFYAADENSSGNRNNGHLMAVRTQTQRAQGARATAIRFAKEPTVVGLHWFQFYDDPTGGRPDGEDYNFGLIDVRNGPYRQVVEMFTDLNPTLEGIHRRASIPPAVTKLRIPRARIDVDDESLAEWPKEASLVSPFKPAPGEVAFGDAHLAWSEDGLVLALIAMDYYDPELLEYDRFPSSEAFHLDIGLDAGAGAHHFVLSFVPSHIKLDSRGLPRMLTTIDACRVVSGTCGPAPEVRGRSIGMPPRLVLEALLPWRALGMVTAPRTIRVEIGVTAFHQSRWMSLSGTSPRIGMATPKDWPEMTLEP